MRRIGNAFLVPFVAALSILSCAQEEYPQWLWMEQHPSADASSASLDAGVEAEAALPGPTGPQFCRQARSTELPQRLAAVASVMTDGGAGDAITEAAPAGTTYYVADLYQLYTSVCGGCHGTVQGLGDFDITSTSGFARLMTSDVLAHVMSNGPSDPSKPNDPGDPRDPMPPFYSSAGKPYNQRSDTDPVLQLALLIQQWLKLDKPTSFVVASAATADAGTQATFTEVDVPIPNAAIRDAMTNIGNCIPSPGLVGVEQTRSAALDKMFAAARSIAPGSGVTAAQMIGLPDHLSATDLFTFDSAVLARYGVVAYAPGYPLWSDNAGKLRHIRVPRGTSVKFDGATQSFTIPANTRFYKTFMKEIVDVDGSVRHRKIETRLIVSRPDKVNADGSRTPQALFGTYMWNDDESDAELLQLPLNSGQPFSDHMIQYVSDEPLAADILSGGPADPQEALLEQHAARHYAIPSSQRCVQCHMGSESQSFVLGFLPLQINRRAENEGGNVEATGPDELTQLQRLVDYGIVTGVSRLSDVLPLEQSQGSRAPRNSYELIAQGYMLGNCAHCHNPGGLPSVQNPILADILNFYPGPGANGGIFQYPLERYSPRIFRGSIGQTPIPYITPSLMDLPRFDLSGALVHDPFTVTGADFVIQAMYAPWRSLIYRNVDNAFAYTDDLALYPHMPMNTPGYDPRARQIMSDWMVSIPAIRKAPDIPEYAVIGNVPSIIGGNAVDTNPQPYVEVFPGDPRYATAQLAAQNRVSILHTGNYASVPTSASSQFYSRYADPEEIPANLDDILDPAVEADPSCHPVPTPPLSPPSGPGGPVPGHAHWAVTDTTITPGPWAPRRPDWASVLVSQNTDSVTNAQFCPGQQLPAAQQAALQDELLAIAAVQTATLSPDVRSYLTTPVPFGLWKQKSGCDFSKQKTVGSFTGSSRPYWMDYVPPVVGGAVPAASGPVYMQTPGQAVFKMICINCHGPKADSQGRLAQNLQVMTGGVAAVADFRDGLFGPAGSWGDNARRVFGSPLPADAPASWQATAVDDRAARYMAWMALGGTEVRIPEGILQIVALTQVLDQHRKGAASEVSANMLSTAKSLCTMLLGCHSTWEVCGFNPTNPAAYSKTLIHTNYDAELWLNLCSLGSNQAPIHLVNRGGVDGPFDSAGNFLQETGTLVDPRKYPPSTPVGNQHGGTDASLQTSNLWPWCEIDTATATANNWPLCPAGLNTAENELTAEQADAWAVRGAVNAGFGVYLYVQSLLKMNAPPPDYNQCEQLNGTN